MIKTKHLLEFFALSAIWGGSFLFMRIGAPIFGPIPLIELRTAIAALFLLVLMVFSRQYVALSAHWRTLLLVGIMNTAIPFSLLAYATLFLSAGYTSIMNATTPLFGAIVTYLWLQQERLNIVGVLGLIIGFAGVFILLLDKSSVPVSVGWFPVVAPTIAAFFYGISANFIKKRLANVEPLVIATGSQIGAAVALLPLSIVFWPEQLVTARIWYDVIALGIVCTGIAYILYFRLINHIGPTRATTVTYVVPVFGMIWGLLFLHEAITTDMLAGGGLILLGMGLTSGLFLSKSRYKAIDR